MDLLFILFDKTPFVIIICILVTAISLFLKKENISIVFFMFLLIYSAILFCTVPFALLVLMFENINNIMFMTGIIVAVWGMVYTYIYIRNIYIIKKNKTKEIYIRDVNVEYSPAVLSYLMNNKIEPQKDLPATLLNLCTKGIIEIKKDEDGTINIIDLKNETELSKLASDEKYAHKILLEGINASKIACWKNKVENEYAKYKFSLKHKRPLVVYLIILFVMICVPVTVYMVVTGRSKITGKPAEIIAIVGLSPLLGAWIIIAISNLKKILRWILGKSDKYKTYFKDTYTKKGAQEYSRWKKFERFMLDFSLIDEKDYDSIVIWGKYLSYSIALGINKKCDKELMNKIKSVYLFNYDMFVNLLKNKEE